MSSLQQFNELKNKAKSLGINVKGMKKEQILEAIAQAEQPAEPAVTVSKTVEDGQTTEVSVVLSSEKPKGRPIDPNSARQKRLTEILEKKEKGMLRLGRPIVEGSARQIRLQERKQKMEAGLEIKRGRPKMVKAEPAVAEPAVAEPAVIVEVN